MRSGEFTKSVQKVLNEHPHTVSIYRFLQTQTTARKQRLKFVLWDAVEERYLFGDLMYGLLNRRKFAERLPGNRLQVYGHNSNTI